MPILNWCFDFEGNLTVEVAVEDLQTFANWLSNEDEEEVYELLNQIAAMRLVMADRRKDKQ